MTLIPVKKVKVDARLRVYVSKHFCYSDFGVLDSRDQGHYGRRFICSGTPGTGFIERESESHSYHDFVRGHPSVQPPSYWRLLLNREPSFDRELKMVNALMHNTNDPRKRELLECYANALTVGRIEENIQRYIRGVKKKMGHHHNKHMVSVISHYKHKISQLERDVISVEYNVNDHYSPEVMRTYTEMVDAFAKMVDRCRRIWHHNDSKKENFVQVFFDLGVFDYIRADCFLPLLRDSLGVEYYLLPDTLIVARSSTDFDLVPLKTLTMVFQEMAIEETTELLSSRVGDAACMMLVPELHLTFYFNHAHVVIDFIRAIDELKKQL